MKLIKRLLAFLLFLLMVVIVGIIALPFLYKDQVITYVKDEANKTLNAKMNFEDVDISLLRSFPDLNVRLENVTVDGIAAFKGVRLFEAVGTEVELNVLDAFAAKDNFPVKSFFLNQPVINLLVLKDGQANWDIMKPSENTEESNFLVKMKQYTIENGIMNYEDRSLDMKMVAKDLNHTGSGQFASDNFDLATRTHISNLDVTYEGVDYLANATADLDALIAMDIPNMKFTLKDNELLLNALKINTAGTFDMNGEDYVMDLTFNSPQGDFKSLWSLIPGVFTADYAAATIDGKMGFKGFVKGTYNAIKGRYPAFQILADVDNGNVKYPDLPVGIAGIFTNMKVESPSGDFDKMVVDIPQFKMKVGDNPVTGAFNLTTPVSDPTVKGNLKGIINLEEIGRAVPIEGITELKGIVKSDVVFNASQSQLDKGQYEQVNIEGTMSIDDVSIQQTGTPPIVINNLTTDFSPQRVKLESFNAKLGESDIQATGQVDNLLAYFSPDKTMEGTINYSSNYFNVNEWVSEVETPATTSESVTADSVATPFDRFKFKVDGFINKMDYDTYQLTDVKTKGSISPNESTIDNFSTMIGKSDIQVSGKVVNLMDYALENEVLTGEIQLKSKYLDLNQFMVEGAATDTTEALSVVPVPERVDLILHTDISKVHYTNFDISNINGFIEVKDEVAKMEDIKGKILGGNINFGGSYDTQNMAAPKFSLNYDLAKLDFNNAFKTFNTFRLIAPLGKYIDGKFTSKLKMSGTLGKDLIPDLSSLNLSGFLHTFGATIRESKTFKKLSEKLQIKALENVKLQDSKNWVDIKDGYLELEEATHNIGRDISLKVKGRHHLLQEDLFYLIEATIPKSEINKTAVGQVANQGWDLLTKEAQKRGVDIDNGDMVKLNINMTGSMDNPSFKIIPVGTDGSVSFEDKANEIVKATVDKAVDSARTVVNEKVDSVRNVVQTQVDSVKTVVNEVKDSLKVVAQEKTDQVLDKGKAEASKILDSVLVKNVPLLDSLLLKDSTKATDKVKDILKDFNPFKKKKNGN